MNIEAFFIGGLTAFFAIFAVHILYFRQHPTHFQKVLGGIMAVWALWTVKDLVFTFPGMYRSDVLRWVMVVDGWSALTYTVFILETTMPRWLTWRRFLLFCLPFVAFTVLYALFPTTAVIIAYAVFLWCYAWTIVIVSYFRVRRHVRYVRENFSNIDEIDLSWLGPVFFFAIVTQLLWLGVSLFSSVAGDVTYYVTALVLWLVVLHYSWNFKPIALPATVGEQQQQPVVRDYPFAGELEHIINERQLYLERNLTLADLAQAVSSNRTYVSAYLTQEKGMTFYDYINQLRIEKKSIPLMQAHPEYTLEHVAYESGFNSVSTFRRAFVKLRGQTPSQFLRVASPTS